MEYVYVFSTYAPQNNGHSEVNQCVRDVLDWPLLMPVIPDNMNIQLTPVDMYISLFDLYYDLRKTKHVYIFHIFVVIQKWFKGNLFFNHT